MHGHVHVASIGTPGRRKDCAIILAGWEGEYEHSGAVLFATSFPGFSVCQVWNCMKSWVSVELLSWPWILVHLLLGSKPKHVKRSQNPPIISHHLLSMSALSAQVGLEALNHLSKQPIIRNLPRGMKHVWGGYHSAQWYLQLANQLVVHRPSTTKTSCIPWHFLARVRPAIKLMVFLSVELRPKPEKVLLEGLEVFILVILGSWAWIVRWKDRHVIVYLLYVGVIMT